MQIGEYAVDSTNEKGLKEFLEFNEFQYKSDFENLYKNKYKRPKYVFVFTKRVSCLTPDIENKGKNAVCFAWFMWQKGYRGSTQIKWIVDGEIR